MTVVQNLVGPMYEVEGRVGSYRRLINWYVEENHPGHEYNWLWINCPGTETYVDTAQGECRAILAKNDLLYIVAGNKLYSCDVEQNLTQLGQLETSTGFVDYAEGVDEILFTDGSSGYSYQITDNSFERITDTEFPSFTRSLTFQDGFFIAATPDSSTFYISAIDDARTWGALDFASKATYGDTLTAVFSHASYLWLFGTQTTEIFYLNPNAGSDFPFVKQQGTFLDIGCAASKSIVRAGGTFLWVSRHKDGGYFIVHA